MSVAGQLRFEPARGAWTVAKDGDLGCLALFKRHYSRKAYRDGREQKLFCGPGFKSVLVTASLDALFVWRKFKSGAKEPGINCAVFRNEGPVLSSALIMEAEEFAWERWPRDCRLYTYVSASKTRHKRDPGRCFLKAGWRYIRNAEGKPTVTKWNRLVILEKWRVDMSSEVTKHDIGTEEWREYEFGGRVYRIEAPKELYSRPGGTTHRVVDGKGITHCVPAPGIEGCVLRWKATPPVSF